MIVAVPFLTCYADSAATVISAQMMSATAFSSHPAVISVDEFTGEEMAVLPDLTGNGRRMPMKLPGDLFERLVHADTDLYFQAIG